MLRRNKDTTKGSGTGANPYVDRRARALASVEAGLTPPGPAHPTVWGVVIDLPTGDRQGFTLVALGDGTTLMHASGGQTIDASTDDAATAVAERLLAVIEREWLDHLADDDGSLPRPDQARYHVLQQEGVRGLDVPRDMVWGHKEGGGDLVAATQRLIEAIRNVEPAPPA
ncbi:hypothetical protein [Aquihabitans sp. McL0605]|uniref:hypothetical protein n=1 Tax=Aquihabitans sp. McL0605 TaxID=3415671 RepID=UPI003CFA2FF3